jgi:hypothetical protein
MSCATAVSNLASTSLMCMLMQNFIQDGTKGEDFNRNLYNPYLDFATIHVYPQALAIPGSVFYWVNDNYIGSRAVRRHALPPLRLLMSSRSINLSGVPTMCPHCRGSGDTLRQLRRCFCIMAA